MKKFLIILIATFPTLLFAGEGEQRLRAFLENTRTLKASFVQTLTDERDVVQQQSSGRFSLQRPGRFRWEYHTPYPQLIIDDGERIWFFDSELAQATVKSVDKAFASSPAMLLTGDEPLERHFFVEEFAMEGERRWVRLTPIQEDGEYKEIRIAMTENELAAMAVLDNFGSTTHIEFSSLQLNTELNPSQFQFIPAEGVDVIIGSEILD